MRNTIMQNGNLKLCTTAQDDIEYLISLMGDIELMRFTFGKIFDKNEAQEYIKAHFNFHSNLKFSPILLNNKPIGFGGIFKFDDSSYELGYILDKAYWGQGLATKIAIMQRDYILNQLKANVVATSHPQNVVSHRVLQKCGFKYIKDIVLEYRGERKLFRYYNCISQYN